MREGSLLGGGKTLLLTFLSFLVLLATLLLGGCLRSGTSLAGGCLRSGSSLAGGCLLAGRKPRLRQASPATSGAASLATWGAALPAAAW